MRALIINPEVQRRICDVLEYANAHISTLDNLKDMINGKMRPVGDNPNHVCEIPQGYRVVFSLEEQPSGVYRHLSVSIDKPGKVPHFTALQMLINEFGFEVQLTDKRAHVWTENIDNGIKAVNIIEPLDAPNGS